MSNKHLDSFFKLYHNGKRLKRAFNNHFTEAYPCETEKKNSPTFEVTRRSNGDGTNYPVIAPEKIITSAKVYGGEMSHQSDSYPTGSESGTTPFEFESIPPREGSMTDYTSFKFYGASPAVDMEEDFFGKYIPQKYNITPDPVTTEQMYPVWNTEFNEYGLFSRTKGYKKLPSSYTRISCSDLERVDYIGGGRYNQVMYATSFIPDAQTGETIEYDVYFRLNSVPLDDDEFIFGTYEQYSWASSVTVETNRRFSIYGKNTSGVTDSLTGQFDQNDIGHVIRFQITNTVPGPIKLKYWDRNNNLYLEKESTNKNLSMASSDIITLLGKNIYYTPDADLFFFSARIIGADGTIRKQSTPIVCSVHGAYSSEAFRVFDIDSFTLSRGYYAPARVGNIIPNGYDTRNKFLTNIGHINVDEVPYIEGREKLVDGVLKPAVGPITITDKNGNSQILPNSDGSDYEIEGYSRKCTNIVDRDDFTNATWETVEKVESIPDDYQQVEYLESDGDQWIDTGFICPKSFSSVHRYYKISNISRNPFGVDLGSSPREMHGHIWGSNWYRGSAGSSLPSSQLTNTWYTVKNECDGTTFSCELNGALVFNKVGLNGWDGATNTDYLFATNKGDGAIYQLIGRLSIAKYYDGTGVLKRNFIPCYRKSDNKPGMYDIVTKTFYTNSGTGEFTLGPKVITPCLRTTLTDPTKSFADYAVNANIESHKYWVRVKAHKESGSSATSIGAHWETSGQVDIDLGTAAFNTDGDAVLSTLMNEPATQSLTGTRFWIQNNYATGKIYGDTVYTRDFQVMDLTKDFGSGNEPTTVAACEEYYGTIYHEKGTSIMSCQFPITIGDKTIDIPNDRLPSEYKEVEYLESTGTQYIDLNYKYTVNDSIYCDFCITDDISAQTNGIYGHGSGNFGLYGVNLYKQIAASKVAVTIGGRLGQDYFATNNRIENNTRLVSKIIGNTLYINGQTVTVGNNLANGDNSTFSIFRRYGSDPFIGRMYNFKIVQSILITNFIPCVRKSDNKPGMYDLANSGKNLFDDTYGTTAWLSGIRSYDKQTREFKRSELVHDSILKTYNNDILKPNTTYTISIIVTTNTYSIPVSVASDIRFPFGRQTSRTISSGQTGTFTVSWTTPSVIETQNFGWLWLYSGNNGTGDFVFKVQIEEGSAATDYEPYPFYINSGTGEFLVGPDVHGTLKKAWNTPDVLKTNTGITKNNAIVGMNELDWAMGPSIVSQFSASIPLVKTSQSRFLSNKYDTLNEDYYSSRFNNYPNKTIGKNPDNSKIAFIKDTSHTTLESFNQSISNDDHIIYELASPTTTAITPVSCKSNQIPVDANGVHPTYKETHHFSLKESALKTDVYSFDGTFIQNVGARPYQTGDEDDTTVKTDGITTYYPLTTPITTSVPPISLRVPNIASVTDGFGRSLLPLAIKDVTSFENTPDTRTLENDTGDQTRTITHPLMSASSYVDIQSHTILTDRVILDTRDLKVVAGTGGSTFRWDVSAYQISSSLRSSIVSDRFKYTTKTVTNMSVGEFTASYSGYYVDYIIFKPDALTYEQGFNEYNRKIKYGEIPAPIFIVQVDATTTSDTSIQPFTHVGGTHVATSDNDLNTHFAVSVNGVYEEHTVPTPDYPLKLQSNIGVDKMSGRDGPALPSAYQEVEYLYADTVNYIDTNIKASDKIEVEFDGYSLGNTSLFGAVSRINVTGSGGYYRYDAYNVNNFYSSAKVGDRHRYKTGQGKHLIDGSIVHEYTQNSYVSNLMILLNGRSTSTVGRSDEGRVYIYNCKIWDDSILVRNFVPCYRKSDNKPGMYDTVNGVFYTNAGTGEFTLGPNVSAMHTVSMLKTGSTTPITRTVNALLPSPTSYKDLSTGEVNTDYVGVILRSDWFTYTSTSVGGQKIYKASVANLNTALGVTITPDNAKSDHYIYSASQAKDSCWFASSPNSEFYITTPATMTTSNFSTWMTGANIKVFFHVASNLVSGQKDPLDIPSKGEYTLTSLTTLLGETNAKVNYRGVEVPYVPPVPPTPGRVPDGYTEIEYVEYTGAEENLHSGFILDLGSGYEFDENCGIETKFMPTASIVSNIYPFGRTNPDEFYPMITYIGPLSRLTVGLYTPDDVDSRNVMGVSIAEPITLSYNVEQDFKVHVDVDNWVDFTLPFGSGYEFAKIGLGNMIDGYYQDEFYRETKPVKIYEFKIYRNGELEREIIPCRDDEGNPYFYDNFSETIISATGTPPTIGPDVN